MTGYFKYYYAIGNVMNMSPKKQSECLKLLRQDRFNIIRDYGEIINKCYRPSWATNFFINP